MHETASKQIEPERTPLVSVVIPAYNSERYLAEALESVFAQDYPAIEVIVVDDGSSDGTPEVVERFAPRVRYLRQANSGSAAARNLGIGAATGFYVAFIDADDVWAPDKLSRQIRALLGSGHALAYSRFIRWHPAADGQYLPPSQVFADPTAGELSDGKLVTGWPYVELLEDCIVWTSTVLVEREALLRAGPFDLSLRKGQDYDLWLRLARDISMLAQDIPLALYRIHTTSITGAVRKVNYEYKILKQTVDRFGLGGPDGRQSPPGLVERRLARSALNHGLQHLRGGDPDVALESIGLSLRHGGLQPRVVVFWVMAWARRALTRLRGAG